MQDSTIFQAALACSSGHLALLHVGADMTEALTLYASAVHMINNRLRRQEISDELMTAIAVITLFEVSRGPYARPWHKG